MNASYARELTTHVISKGWCVMRTFHFRSFAITAAAFLGLALGLANVSAFAQDKTSDVTIGKKGEVHFNIPVKAGGTLLQPGMYQLQHGVEGGQHYVTFKEVQMPAGYRHSNTPVDKNAAARIPCNVEPLEKKVGKTAVSLRTNAAGEKEVADVQISGEAVKHVL